MESARTHPNPPTPTARAAWRATTPPQPLAEPRPSSLLPRRRRPIRRRRRLRRHAIGGAVRLLVEAAHLGEVEGAAADAAEDGHLVARLVDRAVAIEAA